MQKNLVKLRSERIRGQSQTECEFGDSTVCASTAHNLLLSLPSELLVIYVSMMMMMMICPFVFVFLFFFLFFVSNGIFLLTSLLASRVSRWS